MKRLFFFFIAIAFVVNLEAQDAGIQFSHTDWEQTLKMAKEQDKLIFVDAYTDWCGPCKWMNANVFPDKAVGDLYNDKYINVKIDMEKGEGILFAKAYEVKAYPTFLWINARGELVHKSLGGKPAEDFVVLGEAASDPEQQVGTLMKKYDNGDRSPELLRNYAMSLTTAGMKGADEAASQYMASQTDWKTAENMKFVLATAPANPDSELFKFVKSNRKAYADMGEQSKAKTDYLMRTSIQRALYSKESFDQSDVMAIHKDVMGATDGPKMGAEFWMQHLSRKAKDPQFAGEYMTAAVDFMDTYKAENWNILNSVAWRFYELTDDAKMLQKAKAWAKQSVEMEGNYFNYDTLASICYKLQDKNDAMKYAKKAIELAAADGEEAKETKELVEKINAL